MYVVSTGTFLFLAFDFRFLFTYSFNIPLIDGQRVGGFVVVD